MDRVDYQKMVVQDLSNLHKREELNLNPWYQRREVWKPAQKAYLINTLAEEKPIPTIYIRHSIDIEKSKSIQEVVDGQQRCKAILEYLDDGFAAWHPDHSGRVLYSALTTLQKKRFLLSSLSVGYLLGAIDEDVVEIFARINSVSKTLNSQEKRNANFSGEFKQYCLRESIRRLAFWRNYGIFSKTDISRMLEVQFISEIVMAFLDGVMDQKQSQIDGYYDKFDESFSHRVRVAKRIKRVFDILVDCEPASIQDTIFSRQPIFYSLVICIDKSEKITSKVLAPKLWQIDEEFRAAAEGEGSKRAIEFYSACSTTTQRIKQRLVRNKYIQSAIE